MKHMDFTKDKNLLLLCKRLRRYYRNETGYSITLKKWSSKSIYMVKRINRFDPGKGNDLLNIALTLHRHFGYKDVDIAFIEAEKIYKQHFFTIFLYMAKWFEYGTSEQRVKQLSPKKALKEHKARGFKPSHLTPIDASLPYIKSLVGDLIYPIQWPFKPNKNMCGIYERRIGVSGYTAIVLPKGLLTR